MAAIKNTLGMYFDSDNRISIYRRVLRVLGDPNYINFWWGERERVLLISTTQEPNENSVCTAYFIRENQGLRIREKRLYSAISALMEKKDISACRLSGEYVSEMNMVVFKVDDLKRLTHSVVDVNDGGFINGQEKN